MRLLNENSQLVTLDRIPMSHIYIVRLESLCPMRLLNNNTQIKIFKIEGLNLPQLSEKRVASCKVNIIKRGAIFWLWTSIEVI